VISLYAGRAAEEVEKQVTVPLEVALSGLPGAVRMFSHTQFGLSFLILTFDDRANGYFARQQVVERLREVDLPEGVQAELAPFSTAIGEIYRYRIKGDKHTPRELRTYQDWVVSRQLRLVPGVADIVSLGGLVKQYEVRPDLAKLRDYKVTLGQLSQAIQRGNANAGGSYVEQGRQQYLIRGIGLFTGPEDIENVVVAERGGTPILVRHLATVELGSVPRQGIAGQDAEDDIVTGVVLMRRGENPSEVLKRVRAKVDTLNDTALPGGVKVVPIYDRTWLIGKTLKTVFGNLAEGALLVSLVLYLFLGNLRAAAIVALTIPLALLATFLGLTWVGIPANLLSLGAMDFGIIVDGAVIVVENIFRRLTEARHDHREFNHQEFKCVILEAATEVGPADAVLDAHHHRGPHPDLHAAAPRGPHLRADGLLGGVRPHRRAGALAHAGAAAVRRSCSRRTAGEGELCVRAPSAVRAGARLGSGNQGRSCSARVVALAGEPRAGAAARHRVPARAERGRGLGQPDAADQRVGVRSAGAHGRVRSAIRRFPEVASVTSKSGRPEDGTDPKLINMAEFLVDLKPETEWKRGIDKRELLREMDAEIVEDPGLEPSFSQPIRDNVLESISQIDGQIVVKVFGDDLERCATSRWKCSSRCRTVPGVARAFVDRLGELPQIQIKVDRARAARYGLNVGDVAT
jgi:cobalt-zinc-cadmium resistance protein CzcA